MFKVQRFAEIRSFDTFAEARRFVLREGDACRLWSYIGVAQIAYEASIK